MSNDFSKLPDLLVTRGDGVPLPDQAAAVAEFKRQCLKEKPYPYESVPLPKGVKPIGEHRLNEILSGYEEFPACDLFEIRSLAYEVRNCRMRLASLEKDAARYQFIRSISSPASPPLVDIFNPRDIRVRVNTPAYIPAQFRAHVDAVVDAEMAKDAGVTEAIDLCSDCPPVGYPTDETRCAECPRATAK